MRFATFLALLIVTFAACVSISDAKSAPRLDQGRNLRAQLGGLAAKADDIAASITKRTEHAGNFIEKLQRKALLTKAGKFEDAGNTAYAGMLREYAGPLSRLSKTQKEKLGVMVTRLAKQNPKKWYKTKEALIAFGIIGVGGAAYATNAYLK